MLCANPAAGRAFCRFMIGRIGGVEPGSARATHGKTKEL